MAENEKVYKCLSPVGMSMPVKTYPLAPRLDTSHCLWRKNSGVIIRMLTGHRRNHIPLLRYTLPKKR